MSEINRDRLFLLVSICFVVLSIIGGIRLYSPVPYWDMWDGYLGFYVKASAGDWSAWWAQHNEHRIVISRILFWLDIRLFAGRGIFLIICNYLLLAVICWLFIRIYMDVCREKFKWFYYFLIAWLFFWLQKENLVWSFQSQFYLAQALPLLSLYVLRFGGRVNNAGSKFFALALVIGIASVGTMANGIITLPLMTIFALVANYGRKKVALLAIASITTIFFYFVDYVSPSEHGSLFAALRYHPVQLVHYVLVYLGNCFSIGNSTWGLWTATIAGMFFVASTLIITWKFLFKAEPNPNLLVPFLFIVYIGGTALGTAGGRSMMGIEQALSGRYATPSLMAWAALMILLSSGVLEFPAVLRKNTWIILLLLLGIMSIRQVDVVKNPENLLFERKISALALELGVKDQAQINHIFPEATWALSLARIPIERKLSIFGEAPLDGLNKKLGTPLIAEHQASSECLGHLDAINIIPEDTRFLSIRGWLHNTAKAEQAELIQLIDSNQRVVGFALRGALRPDVGAAVGKLASRSGFAGYIYSFSKDDLKRAVDSDLTCELTLSKP